MDFTFIKLKQVINRLHRVSRFTSYTMIKPKSVLEHSARVAMLYQYLGGKEVFAALMHDMSEAFLGFDCPSPVKAKIPAIKEFELLPEHSIQFISDDEKKLCKLCDGIELLIDLKEQQSLGNQTTELMEIYDQVIEEVMERAKALGRKSEIKKLIQELTK